MIIENHLMNRIYKISFQIYRIILILALPTFLFTNFLVAKAGHNSPMKIDDYFLLGFVILVPTLLTILIKTDKAKISLRKTIRFVIIGLISTSMGFFFYGLYDSWLLYQDQNFGIGDTIPVAIIIFLIALSFLLLVGLAKNRI